MNSLILSLSSIGVILPLFAIGLLLLLWASLRFFSWRARQRRHRLFASAHSQPCATTTTWEALHGKGTISDLPVPRDFERHSDSSEN